MSKSALRSTQDVMIQVPDVKRALEFYTKVMGLKLREQNERYACVDTGAFPLFIEKGGEPGAVFEFLADDLEATKAQLLAAGCTVVEEDPELPRLYLRDPYGLTFNLGRR